MVPAELRREHVGHKSRRGSVILLVALASSFAGRVQADPVTVRFAVKVELANVSRSSRPFADLFGFPVGIGDKFEGIVTYEPTTPPYLSGERFAYYGDPAGRFR